MKQIIFLVAMAFGVTAVSLWSHRPETLPVGWNHEPRTIPSSGAARMVLGRKISINTATFQDLQALPGIGPGRARAILEFREAYGEITRLESLLRIPGIGPKTFKDLVPWVNVSETQTPVQK